MDHKLILAVAGSGKTTFIVNDIDPDKRNIVVGYTIANVENLKKAITRRFEGIPEKTKVMTYYRFVNSFCYRPILAYSLKTKGIIFEKPPNKIRDGRNNRNYFITSSGYVYSNRIHDLIARCNRSDDVLNRINMFCDKLYIDEVQDYGGHDFSFITSLNKLKTRTLLVGDFYQNTFKTSTDNSKNKNSHSSIEEFEDRFSGFYIDKKTLVKSFRCTPTVCDFVREKLGINMYSHRKELSEIVYVNDLNQMYEIYNDDEIVKLFIKDHHKENCYSNNWGLSKGEDKYNDICIILTDVVNKAYSTNDYSTIAKTTKVKFYVALTRAKNNVYLVDRKLVKKMKEKCA